MTYYFQLAHVGVAGGPAALDSVQIAAATDGLQGIACGFEGAVRSLPVRLAANTSIVCSAKAAVTQADIEAGALDHAINVTVAQPDGYNQTFSFAQVKTVPLPSMAVSVVSTGCNLPEKARKYCHTLSSRPVVRHAPVASTALLTTACFFYCSRPHLVLANISFIALLQSLLLQPPP